MGYVNTPLTFNTVPDSIQNIDNFGADIYYPFQFLEQFVIPRYIDAASGADRDVHQFIGQIRYVINPGRFERREFVGVTPTWVPLTAGESAYYEQATSNDTSAGTFGVAAAATLVNAPVGRYAVLGLLACQATSGGLIYPRLRVGNNNVGTDIPNSVPAGSFFSTQVFAEFSLSAAVTSSLTVSVQGQLSSGILHLNPGSRIHVFRLGL